MDRVKIVFIVVAALIVVSLATNVFLGVELLLANKKVLALQQSKHLNASVLNFADLFISKVLRADSEIPFEDRLKIENAVRDTQDKDIYDQWQKFVGVKTESEGKEEIKNLLQLIINKLSV